VTSQLRPPSNIPTGHTYSVFRGGVLPDWEDVANVKGGRWMIPCPKVEREDRLDTRWLEVLFMLVGEHIGESSRQVNGAEACVRTKGDRLEVWVRDINMMKEVLDVGRKVKNKLGLDTARKIKFALHKEDKEGVKGPRLAL
jgi:translation initiation factor 4E